MINTNNYHDSIRNIAVSTLPEVLRKGHEFVAKATDNGAHWDNYHASSSIKKMVDTYFVKLGEYLDKHKKSGGKAAKAQPAKAQPAKSKAVKQSAKQQAQEKCDDDEPFMVERIPEEIKFIKRFLGLDGKTKTKEQILSFLNSLQKAILEKKIRKTSRYLHQVEYIQGKLIETYNDMKDKIVLALSEKTRASLSKFVSGEMVFPSVNFIKRYINLNGKPGMKEKAASLLTQINKAYQQGIIDEQDPYLVEMHEVKKNLNHFISTASVKTLKIERNELRGLEGVLGCACQNLNGIDGDEGQPVIMNSMDFAEMEFETLGFRGKWRDFIGDPSTNFTMMVYGKPKFGKSILCIDFAAYLARNHGKVLYVAKEEGLDKTLRDKLDNPEIKHPSLYVTSSLPQDLSYYDFIFLDSVSSLYLTPEYLKGLKAMNPTKSFIYIFQTTKDGKFRGTNTFQHDVDSVIEVPEKGMAVQYGRFNAGGEMCIF